MPLGTHKKTCESIGLDKNSGLIAVLLILKCFLNAHQHNKDVPSSISSFF